MFKVIEIETYNICNRKCNYCPNSINENEPHYMDEKLFYKIIDQLSDLDYKGRISLHRYGEPLLDKRLNKFVKYAKDRCPGAYITIFTNGDYLDYKHFKELSKDGVDSFFITIHSKFNENHISLLLNSNDEDKTKIKMMKSQNLHLYNRGGLLPKNRNIPENSICINPSDFMIINSFGKAVLCCMDYHSSVVYGNLNNEKLIDVWNNEKISKIREELSKGNRNCTDICKKCDCLDFKDPSYAEFPYLPPWKEINKEKVIDKIKSVLEKNKNLINLGIMDIKDYKNISHKITDKDYQNYLSKFFNLIKLNSLQITNVRDWFNQIIENNIQFVFLNEFTKEIFEYRDKNKIDIGFIVRPYVFEPWKNTYKEISKYLTKKDIILCASNYLEKEFKKISENYNCYNMPVVIDSEKYSEIKSDYKENEFLNLLYCARIIPEKGLSEIIESLQYLDCNFHLNIISPITNLNPNEKRFYEEIIEKIKDNNLNHKITFHGSLIDNIQKKITIFSETDILLNLSTYSGETFGRVIVEAFASGCAVITTNWQALNEIIIPNKNGFLVNIDENNNIKPKDIAENIKKLQDNNILNKIKENNVLESKKYDYKINMINLRKELLKISNQESKTL
jgi:hypothetical protein